MPSDTNVLKEKLTSMSPSDASQESWAQLVSSGDLDGMAKYGTWMWRKDPLAAKGFLVEAAQKGSWRAAYKLSSVVTDSRERSEFRLLTLAHCRTAAAAGDVDAMTVASGLLYRTDPNQAITLSRNAAEMGSIFAMGQLANLLAEKDPEEAEFWENQGVAAGDINSLYRRGRRLEASDRAQAISLYRRAAEGGQSFAMERLAYLAKAQDDVNEAIVWYQRAADKGNSSAMYELARAVYGTSRDEALVWLRKAAAAGNIRAMKTLAAVLEETSWDEARRWIQRAADEGDAQALIMLRRAPLKRPVFQRAKFRQLVESWLRDRENPG